MGKRAPSKGGRVEQTGYYELQNLESRLLLSGSVTAVIDGSGNLTITGTTTAAVNITITSDGANAWEITGKKTLINGSKSNIATGVTGNISINLNSGNDHLTVKDGDILGDLYIATGDGADTTSLSNLQIANYLNFNANEGNDSLCINNVHVLDPTDEYYSTITAQDGNNTDKVNDFTDQDLEVKLGDGNNSFDMNDSTFLDGTSARLMITAGNGNDQITLDSVSTSPLTIALGNGRNHLNIDSSLADTFALTEGTGHNKISITDSVLDG